VPQIKKIYVKSGKPVAPLTRHAEMTVLGRVKKLLLQPSKKLIAALLVLALLVIAANIVSVITKKDQTDNTPDNFYSGAQNLIEEKETPLPQPDPVEKLIADTAPNFSGEVAIYIKDLKTGKSWEINSDQKFPSASIYKLAVMWAVYDAIEKNQLKKDSVAEALRLMITISDNDSAILLAEKLGWSSIDKLMEEEGLGQIDLAGPDSPSATARSVGDLLERIYRGSAVSQQASGEMKTLLFAQQINDRIPKYLPEDIKVGHKTGELDSLRHDVGIILGKKSDYIFVFLSNTTSTENTSEQIALLSKEVFDALENQ